MADLEATLGDTPTDLRRRRRSITPLVPGTSVQFASPDMQKENARTDGLDNKTAAPYNNSTVAHLSYAPATQTTVVTTTTTTTTNFPPFVMRAPRHLDSRDPKLYPLAASPTPSSIRDFKFSLNGKMARFREADDAKLELSEYNRQHTSLGRNNGILQHVTSVSNEEKTPARPSKRQNIGETRPTHAHADISSQKRQSATPISLSDAAELASLRRRSATSRYPLPRFSLPGPHPLRQDQTQEHLSESDDNVEGSQSLQGISQRSTSGLRDFAPDAVQLLDEAEEWSPHHQDLSVENLQHFERSAELESVQGLGLSVDRPGTGNAATPPIADSDRDPVQLLHADDYVRPGTRRLLSHTPIQEASLPSPSLSPITGATHLNYESESTDGYERPVSPTDVLQSPHHTNTRRMSNRQTLSPPPADSDEFPTLPSEASHIRLPTPSYMDVPNMLDSFDSMPDSMQTYVMYQLLRRCAKPTLHFVANVVNPALKCDFLNLLPLELSLNVLKYLDAKTMCQAAQVSKKWRHIVNSDERAWRDLLIADGYTVDSEEIERAIREGWGWQHSFGLDDSERDLGSSSSSLASMVEDLATFKPSPDLGWTNSSRRKRKSTSKQSSNKRQKRRGSIANKPQLSSSMKCLELAQGPNRLACAAAAAVPNANVGLPSLSNLHLFKSIYRRHHLIRQSWMQVDSKPQHLAFRAHQRHVVTCLQFDDDRIVTGSDDTNINVYDTKTGALRKTLEGHEGGVWALEYQGDILVSGSTDRSVRIWSIEEGKCLHVFQGHTSTVRCLKIVQPAYVGETHDGLPLTMPSRPLIITGSRDSNLRVWMLPSASDPSVFHTGAPANDHDNPYYVRALTGHLHSVRAIAAHADTLVSGSYDSSVRVWRISTGDLLHRLAGHTTKVYSVVLDWERNRCISGSMDNLVKVWSLESGACLFNLEGHTSLVGLLDLSHDCLVSAAADSTLRIWDPENGRCKNTLRAHTGAITCFQHDGQKVISGSDRTLKMWNVRTGECLKDLLTDLSGVWQVRFNERRCIAAVQRDGVTYIEVLDFGASRDGVPEHERGRRMVVDVNGIEVDIEGSIEPEVVEVEA